VNWPKVLAATAKEPAETEVPITEGLVPPDPTFTLTTPELAENPEVNVNPLFVAKFRVTEADPPEQAGVVPLALKPVTVNVSVPEQLIVTVIVEELA